MYMSQSTEMVNAHKNVRNISLAYLGTLTEIGVYFIHSKHIIVNE